MNTRMMESSSRLIRRLLIFVWMVLVAGASGANAAPVKTLVQDTLYRADGSAAQGSVTVRWNGFSTSAGEAVAAGQMTVTTNVNGGISIPLIPNTGSSPSGSYYRVVITLDDGTTSEEMWVVPAVNTTTVAAIRAKVVPQAVAAQFASRDYLDSALAGLATVASTGNYDDLVNKPASLSTTSASFAGALTAQSVNGVPSVTGYGAKCDGVTNDSAAFLTADALGKTIQGPASGTCVIAANITLNSQWTFNQGAMIAPASGYTVTLAQQPIAGRFKIFSGAGSVVFSFQPVVYPEWWGATPALSPTVDSYPALVSACNSLPYLGNGSQMTYTGQHARAGTIQFQTLYYLISHPWTCSYGVTYWTGGNSGGYDGQAVLELQSGAVPTQPAQETFAWFIDPPATSGTISSNVAFGSRVDSIAVQVDGNKLYSTTLTTAIPATGSQTITVGSTSGMATSGAGSQVWLGAGADFEIVTPTSITSSTQFVATVVNTHASTEAVVTNVVNNYVSGLYFAEAQGSSVRNAGAGHAWGRGCVAQLAPSNINTDHFSCASTLNGPNIDMMGTGAFDFVDAGNNNQTGLLGQVDIRIPYTTGNVFTIPFIGGFVPGSSQVLITGSYSGRYQNCGPSFCSFTRLSCGATPAMGQYAECSNGALTFNAGDASEYGRILYQDTSPITASASSSAVKPVSSVQVEANSDLHINQIFCEGSYDCLNTYRVGSLAVDYLEAHPASTVSANTAAVFVDPYSSNVWLLNQKYFFWGSNKWTYGVVDAAHGVTRTLVTDANNDSYARDIPYGHLAVPATGTVPSGSVAATPGLVYPDGSSITEDSTGKISVGGGAISSPTFTGTTQDNSYHYMSNTFYVNPQGTASSSATYISQPMYFNDSEWDSTVPGPVADQWECGATPKYSGGSPSSTWGCSHYNGIAGQPLLFQMGPAFFTLPTATTYYTLPGPGTLALTNQLPSVATVLAAGLVKPDGTTTTVDADGTIHAAAATESVVGSPINRTGLAANVGQTVAYTVPSGSPGWYRLSCYVVLTQAATTSSTLPTCQMNFYDNDTGVQKTVTLTYGGQTQNTVGLNGNNGSPAGTAPVYAGAGAINYYTSSYASSGATAMQYAMHVKVEYLGQ